MAEPPTPDPPPERAAYRAYPGSGYAGADFRGIGGHLLKSFPPIAPPPAIDPTASGFGVHGPHLLAPMRAGPGGARVSPCPVCLTDAVVPRTAGGWVPSRCGACGTEFIATDGSTPPPAPLKPPSPLPLPPPPEPRPTHPLPPPATPATTPSRKLELWVESGEPARWVAYRRGEWGETELAGLLESLRYTRYWPLDAADVCRVLAEATERYRAEKARAEPSLSAMAYWRGYGKLVAHCPVCAAEIPVPLSAGHGVRMRCVICGIEFVAVDGTVPRPPKPETDPVPPPVPPPPMPAPKPEWETGYTEDVRCGADGSRHTVCPHCRAHDVAVPFVSSPAVTLRCARCGKLFVVSLLPKPPRPAPAPRPRPPRSPVPPPRLWHWEVLSGLLFLACIVAFVAGLFLSFWVIKLLGA